MDTTVFDRARAQRGAHVWTLVVDGIKPPVEIEESELAAMHVNRAAPAMCKAVSVGNGNIITHMA